MHSPEIQTVNINALWIPQGMGHSMLALNNAHAQALSWLDRRQLTHLVKNAFLARAIGPVEAFILAFDQDADYDSPNFLWFRERYDRFVYIDRVVVALSARGRGHARRLYGDLFRQAVAAAHAHVVCEVNLQPPNPASIAFHRTMGFVPVGTATIHLGSKTVTYLSCSLPPAKT